MTEPATHAYATCIGRKIQSTDIFPFLVALSVLALFMVTSISCAGGELPTCEYFYQVLSRLPHAELQINTGEFGAAPDQQQFNECGVTFHSDDSLMVSGAADLPSFRAEEGSELFKAGWREDNSYAADGAGTGAYGIRRDNALCVIRWDQHSWINEAGASDQSHLVNLEVRCREL